MMIQVSGGKMDEKRNQLKEFLLSQGSLAVAFSGGVDSTFLGSGEQSDMSLFI